MQKALVKGRLHFGWIIMLLAFLTILTTAGIRAAPTVLINPLESEFGWTRTAIAFAISVNLLLYGIASPIVGRLIDRYGPRSLMLVSLLLLAVALGGTIFMTSYWQLILLWGVLVGLGAGGGASVLGAVVANRWFHARRGLALGILNSAGSTGQLIFFPFMMAMNVSWGWRAGSMVMAIFALGVVVLIFLWMRDDPADMGLAPYGWDGPAVTSGTTGALVRAPGADVSLRVMFRSSTFWLLAAAFFTCGGTANGLIGTHLVPHSIDHGMSRMAAATTVSIMGGFNFVGTLLAGWLTDRMDSRKILAAVFALRGVSLFFLPFVHDSMGMLAFAVLYGLDWFATVPPVVALTADTFGKRNVGTVFGWIFLAHQVGGASASTLAGAARTVLGDYQLAFLVGGVVALIGAGLALLVPAKRQAEGSAHETQTQPA